MLVFRVDITAPAERMAGIARAAEHPERILRRWGGFLRASARHAAEDQEGWPGWAESTRKKYETTRTAHVTAAGNVRASYGAKLESHLRRKARQGVIGAGTDLAELRRMRAGGRVDRTRVVQSKALETLRKGLEKAATGKRVGGERRKIGRAKLLGPLPRMNTTEISGATVTLMSQVPWSEVQNRGGTAGHGAKIPARLWLDIDDQDRVVLRQIVVESLLGVKH